MIYWSGDATHGPSRSAAVITVVPPTPTETLTLDKRTTRYGTAFHLRVVRSYAGQPLANTIVRFSYLRPGQTTKHWFATVLTNSHGVATASFTPNRNVSFVAGTPGDELWAAAHSATIATTTFNRVTARLSTPDARCATVIASVSPATRLTLQRSIDGVHWRAVATTTGQYASWTVWQSARPPQVLPRDCRGHQQHRRRTVRRAHPPSPQLTRAASTSPPRPRVIPTLPPARARSQAPSKWLRASYRCDPHRALISLY